MMQKIYQKLFDYYNENKQKNMDCKKQVANWKEMRRKKKQLQCLIQKNAMKTK